MFFVYYYIDNVLFFQVVSHYNVRISCIINLAYGKGELDQLSTHLTDSVIDLTVQEELKELYN